MNQDSRAGAQRVLACLLCQQRKVKCDRKFPCSNCLRTGAQCVPATLVPRQRRRRFPERELLARIRHYEELLRQHNVQFEPLHPASSPDSGSHSPHAAQSEPSPGSRDKTAKPRATNVWHALNHAGDSHDDDESDGGSGFLMRDDHDIRDAVIKNTWDRTYHNASASSHHILFGSLGSTVALVTLHPDQAKIFRLWQIYLDNVNPLLKVTHTPSLQARIVDAIGNLANISAPLEALLFSVYCVSVMSLVEDQCQTLFGSPKKDLLAGYQFACRQALLNANVLQSDDHDCLTALHLYLISARSGTDPRSLCSVLSVAIRTAQRLGYHSTNASNTARCTPFEAEMRKRLWWSLVIFDNRVCETFNYRTPTLSTTWDCDLPRNLNDFELLPDMKTVPPAHDKPTEAFFMFVRSELGDIVRHCTFHLDAIDPFLTTLARAKSATGGQDLLDGHQLRQLERVLEEKTLAPCDPENPLHFMTMWTARGYLAKVMLMEHCSSQPDSQQELGITYALTMLECDTQLMSSPLTKGFRWHVQFHFPFLGYTFLAQHLKNQPTDQKQSDAAWEAMSSNYDARRMDFSKSHEPLFVLFSRIVLQAWEAVQREGHSREPPRIVAGIKSKLAEMKVSRPNDEQQQIHGSMSGINPLDGAGMSGNVAGLIVDQQSFGTPFSSEGYNLGMFARDTGLDFGGMDQLWLPMEKELI